MIQNPEINRKIDELEKRVWDIRSITGRYQRIARNGIGRKELNKKALSAEKQNILDRVQMRAEEYNYLAKNCAQGTALALMEEFGTGSMETVKALSPFPGIGGSGEICGSITGSLVVFGLIFGSDKITDYDVTGNTINIAHVFISRFAEKIGYIRCADIQENVIFGKNMNPGASEENMEAFAKAKGFEKCGLAPGIGARLAAELIIENIK